MKTLRLLLLLITVFLTFSAQFEIVSDVKELTGDITAAKFGQKDVNGQWCAILKVHTDIKDLQFEGFGYEKHDYRGEGVYLVYLQPETKSLKFKKDGYIPKSHTFPFRLKGNTVYQIDVKAIEEKKIEDIAITVQSDPPGAEIFLDGVNKGRTEQVTTSVGRHEIRFEMPGYGTKSVNIQVTAENTLFKESLEKTTEVTVEIHSSPEEASVYLNDIKLGETPLATFYPEGEYRLKVVKENFQEVTETVKISKPGLKKRYELTDISAVLTIKTYDKAKVYINGVLYEEHEGIKLLPQQCVVRVEMRTAEPVEERFILSAKESKVLRIYPEIKAGTVQVAVIPDKAQIELVSKEGEIYQSTGSSIFSDVPEGSYSLRITKPGFKTHEQRGIEIKQNSKVNFNITLEEGSDDAFDYVFVEGGTFQRNGFNVTVSSFFIGKYEVSQGQYEEVIGSNPSSMRTWMNPVENVSWFDALKFCNKLSELEGLTKCYNIDEEKNVSCDFDADGYRLPTEAEWEFAAKGGVKSRGYKYSGSDTLSVVGWFEGNSGVNEGGWQEPQPIGRKRPNELGIYDMSGNIWEMCWDWSAEYPFEDVIDPKGPVEPAGGWIRKISRGGSWNLEAQECRTDKRNDFLGDLYESNGITGFRVVSRNPAGKIKNLREDPPGGWIEPEKEFQAPPVFFSFGLIGITELLIIVIVLFFIIKFIIKKRK